MFYFDTEEQALQKRVELVNAEITKFCPLIIGRCMPNCVCFFKGEIKLEDSKYKLHHVGCANGMFD